MLFIVMDPVVHNLFELVLFCERSFRGAASTGSMLVVGMIMFMMMVMIVLIVMMVMMALAAGMIVMIVVMMILVLMMPHGSKLLLGIDP